MRQQGKIDFNWLLFSPRGRISRKPYWAFYTIKLVVSIIVMMPFASQLGEMFAQLPQYPSVETLINSPEFQSILNSAAYSHAMKVSMLLQLVLLWPTIMIDIKRLHDRNRSGKWLLLQLLTMIPLSICQIVGLIGTLWIIIECAFLQGTAGDNMYGADPQGNARSPAAGPNDSSPRQDEDSFDA